MESVLAMYNTIARKISSKNLPCHKIVKKVKIVASSMAMVRKEKLQKTAVGCQNQEYILL
jgi:hypothetical protein